MIDTSPQSLLDVTNALVFNGIASGHVVERNTKADMSFNTTMDGDWDIDIQLGIDM